MARAPPRRSNAPLSIHRSDFFGGKVGAFSILEDYYDSYTSYFDYYGSYGTYGSYAEPPESGLTAFSNSGGAHAFPPPTALEVVAVVTLLTDSPLLH